MKQLSVYEHQYYRLVQLQREADFVGSMNRQPEAVALIEPHLNKLANKLISFLGGESINADHLLNLYKGSEIIDQAILPFLNDDPSYKRVDDPSIQNSLFTVTFTKLCRAIFLEDGLNDSRYFIQSNLDNWLEDNFARVFIDAVGFLPFDTIVKLLDQTQLLHHFYSAFRDAMPPDWIQKDETNWIKVPDNPKDILTGLQLPDGDFFIYYQERLTANAALPSWKFIREAIQNLDHDMFSEDCSIKNDFLFQKQLSLWMKFWDNLKLPILQATPFIYFQNPEDFLKIAQELTLHKDSLRTDPKHLEFILMSKWLDSIRLIRENLSFYLDSERIQHLSAFDRNDSLIEKGKQANENWESEKNAFYEAFFEAIDKILSAEEIADWLFSLKPVIGGAPHIQKRYTEEIDSIQGALKPLLERVPIDNYLRQPTQYFNFQKFIFLSGLIRRNPVNNPHAPNLIRTLEEFLKKDRFVWNGELAGINWNAMKSLGTLLAQLPSPIEPSYALLQRNKTVHEGWNIDINNIYTQVKIESFIYCGAALLLEHPEALPSPSESDIYFNHLLNLLIQQTRFYTIRDDRLYTPPLQILYLISNQILPHLKESFEIKLIEEVDNLVTVLAVLSTDNYQPDPTSKLLLISRIDQELTFTLKQQKNKQQSDWIRKMANKITDNRSVV